MSVCVYLSQTFLSCPHRCVNDLEEELSGSRVEDENGSINWLGGQVTFKGLVRQWTKHNHYLKGSQIKTSELADLSDNNIKDHHMSKVKNSMHSI